MYGNVIKKPKRLSLTKINYIAIHEINHFLALLILLIELNKSKEDIRALVNEVSIIGNREKEILGNVSIDLEKIRHLEGVDFVWTFGCFGAYYYYHGADETTWLDNSNAEEVRDFLLKTGGEHDLLGSKLNESNPETNKRLLWLLKKSKDWCKDMEFVSLITVVAKQLKKKRIFRHKDINILINIYYSFIKEKINTVGKIN